MRAQPRFVNHHHPAHRLSLEVLHHRAHALRDRDQTQQLALVQHGCKAHNARTRVAHPKVGVGGARLGHNGAQRVGRFGPKKIGVPRAGHDFKIGVDNLGEHVFVRRDLGKIFLQVCDDFQQRRTVAREQTLLNPTVACQCGAGGHHRRFFGGQLLV